MSAILGILNLKREKLYPESLPDMMTAMAGWGTDGSGTWLDNHIGMGHLLSFNTPEARYEKLPCKSRCGRFIMVSRARIDNRKDLLKCFNIPVQDYSATPDSALILNAYDKWGTDCVHHLLGDWIFALWDKVKQRLFIARDHHGLTGLYYYHGNGCFAFSSGFNGLLALPWLPRHIDELTVARLLISWPAHGSATVFKKIKRLPPAHTITVDRKGVHINRYWFLEHTPDIRFASDTDYVEAFLEIYQEAVRCRLRSDRAVGVTLSGGLDSGSVATIGARELSVHGNRLAAFCSASIYDVSATLPRNRFDEADYARQTAAGAENIDLFMVKSENLTPIQGIEQGLRVHTEPVHAASNQYWLHALLEDARKKGVGTLLTGAGGNSSISWHAPGYLAQLARTGHWRTLIRELRAVKGDGQRLLTVKSKILLPLIPRSIRYQYQSLRNRQEYPWDDYSAISNTFAKRINLMEKMLDQGHDPYFQFHPDCRKNQLAGIKPGRLIMGCRFQQLGSIYGIELRDPTMDRRVLEFCFGIPDDQFVRNGVDRLLIRRAMEGRMPPNVLYNNKRGLQAADLMQRLRQDTAQLKQQLNCIKSSDMVRDFLDLDKMSDIVAQLEHHRLKPSSRLHTPIITILLRGLMVGRFLFSIRP